MIETREFVISRSQLHKRDLPHGFKAKAKRRSLEVRVAAGFADDDPLDCDRLAHHLGITIVRMSELEPNQHTYHLSEVEPGALSAATVRRGNKTGIWLNDSHSDARQSSNLAHEIAHVLLGHEDAPPLNESGCREYHAGVEAEADYMGSVLLVTDAAALTVVRGGMSIEDAAFEFGVSPQLMRWRVNDSGARIRVQRASRSRR